MLTNIKAVLFDMDGTLIDSMWIWKQIDIDYLKSKNVVMPSDLQRNIEGLSMKETAVYFQENFGITDSIEEMMNTWNEMAMQFYANEACYKPGAKEFLSFLKKQNIKTGIATSNSPELLRAAAKHLQMDNFIDCYLTGNEVAHGKPFPDVYLEVANRLNVEPKHCLVFEDITAGIQAGRAANMKVCAVYDAYSKDCTNEKKALADYYIQDYFDIDFE